MATAPLQPPTSKRSVRPPPKIALGDITINNIGTLRKLNSVLFPVSYSEKFYKGVLEARTSEFCKLVYYNDLPVGAVCCRIEGQEAAKGEASSPRLYIMTLGVLAPYRRQGLATALVNQVLNAASRSHLSPETQALGIEIAPIAAPAPPPPTETPAPAAKKATKKDKKGVVSKDAVVKEEATPPPPVEPVVEPLPPLASAYVHVQIGNEEAKKFYEGFGFVVEGQIEDYYRKVEPRGAWILGKVVEPALEEEEKK